MATAKGRGGAASKSAVKSSTKKSAVGKGASSSARSGGAAKATASKKSAPQKGAIKSAAPKKGGTATKGSAAKSAASKKSVAAKKSAPARGGSTSASRSGLKSATASGHSQSAATATRSAASRSNTSRSSSVRGRAAKAPADPRNDLGKILEDLMKDIYYAEKKLTKALGKMAKNATNPKLKEAFTVHQGQTEEQVSKLEQAFEAIGAKAKAKKCAAMDGLLEEADEHIEEYEKGAGLDAALIVGAQKVEHYEIAAYGSMRSIARTLGHKDAARIFEEIREQESDTDELLTQIAESVVNLEAEEETENVEGGGDSDDSRGGKKGSENSESGEDRSSRSSEKSSSDSEDNDGAGRGISSKTDGNDRGETGEAMGY